MVRSMQLPVVGPSLRLSRATLASPWLCTTSPTILPTQTRVGRVRIADPALDESSVGNQRSIRATVTTLAISGLIRHLTPCPRMPKGLETARHRARYVDLDTRMWT